MTNEQAIAVLQGMIKNPLFSGKSVEAFEMAIKALEQEPCSDAVSRESIKQAYKQRMISGLKDDTRGIDLSKYAEEPYERFCEFVDSIPSIEPKRQLGKWIYQGDKKKPMYAWFSCSSCGAYIGTPTQFCSECGADMRGDAE